MNFWDFLKPETDPYALLGVRKECSAEDIEKAYRKSRNSALLKQAYNCLMDPESRSLYELLHLEAMDPAQALKSVPLLPEYLEPARWYKALVPVKKRHN